MSGRDQNPSDNNRSGLWHICAQVGRGAAALVIGAIAARGLLEASERLPKAAQAEFTRSNHRGETVTLASGSALALAATAAAALTSANRRVATAAVVAGLGAGAAGLYDDIVGNRPEQKRDKGFAGHIQALREGRLSAGMVKLIAIGAAGLLAGAALKRKPIDSLLAAGVVAGTANLMNLLDLRPGRAIKAGLALGGSCMGGPGGAVAAGTVGAAAALLPEDLAERTMLGDAGANAMGALVGVSMAAGSDRLGMLITLAGLVGLNAASEKVSFTKVIESTPVLHKIDQWGRRPAVVKPPAAA